MLVTGILELSLKGDEFRQKTERKRNLSCNEEGRLGRGEYMHKGGRCRMWNEDIDGVRAWVEKQKSFEYKL